MTLNYRVGKTSGAAHVAREFGYNPAQYGNLTPELVHDAARQAKVTDLQKQLATAMNRHVAKIRANKVEIERLTLEAIEGGLTDKAEIDKYVVKAIVAGAKHDQHIVNLEQKLQHELGLIKVQGASTQTLQNMDFRQRLLLIKANHQAKGQIQTNGFQQSLKAIQASPQQAIAMQQRRSAFNNYINAKDFDPIPAVSGGSAGGNSPIANNNGKGFLGGLFDFFTGKN
jgi:phage baseplate assembly protein W